MMLEVHRYHTTDDETLGLLMHKTAGARSFLCYTLEDEYRKHKKAGETRIPEGRYAVRLRTFGGHHQRYSKRFPAFHKGMLEICDVPGFSDILIHIGNDESDTAGCLLVGSEPTAGNEIRHSTKAYVKIYTSVLEALESGEGVSIEFFDMGRI